MMASFLRNTARKLGAEQTNLSAVGAALYSTAPALTSSKSNWSFLTGVFARAPAPLPPLTEPLSGIVVADAEPAAPLSTQSSKLDNGLIIASENSAGSTASVGLFAAAGSAYETPEVAGISHLLERLAFKSTANRSHFRLVRELEAIGANPQVSTSRDATAYQIDGIKTYLPEFVEILADSVLNPVFHEWEVAEQIKQVKREIQQISNQPQSLLIEAMHSAGFAGALGNPQLAPEANLANLTPDVLYEYVKATFTPNRLVLAAAGVDHSELKALAAPFFEDLPAGKDLAPPQSLYVGGEWRAGIQGEFSHVALGFELPGGWLNEKDSIVAYVLQFLMGGGGAFSAGGPGKGMASRLYRRVLGGNEKMESCFFFSNIFDTTGILGVYAATTHDHVEKATETLVKELLALANPKTITNADLVRAKNATLAAVMFALESKTVVAEDIGRQIMTYGERKPIESFKTDLASVTAADVTNLATKILKTPLTLAAIGNVGAVPPLSIVASHFG